MYSMGIQAKPLSSWKALGWALLYFWFFSTLLQAIIYISGYSDANDIRDSLLSSSLWLIPVFLSPEWIKIIAAVIGVVSRVASLAALCYYVICGQEFSQSVLFVMFETNTNEASKYLNQYFSLKAVLIALTYTTVAILSQIRLRPAYIPKPWRYIISFALLYGLILHPVTMSTSTKSKPSEKTLDSLVPCMEPVTLWQFLTGHYQCRQQLNPLIELLNENNALSPLVNFEDESGNKPHTLALVTDELIQRGYMSLYGYPRETTPELGTLYKTGPNLTVLGNVVTSRPYTIGVLQQALIFANEKSPDLYPAQPLLMNMMKQAGYRTFWITNRQAMIARNTMLTIFSCQTDKQCYTNQQHTQSTCEYDTNMPKPFRGVLKDPAPEKLIIVYLLGTHIEYKYRCPEDQGKFDDNIEHVPPGSNAEELESYNDYDSADLYNDHVVANLIKDFRTTDPSGPLVYFSGHGEEVYDTPPHKTQGRNEDNPTCHMYTIPFLLWTSEKRQATRPRDFSQDVDHRCSPAELIHTWSDLAGLSYDGYDPTRSVVSPQFRETTR